MLCRHTCKTLPLKAPQLSTRAFSSFPRRQAYADTIDNLKIGKNTRVIYQGFTGKVSTSNAQQSIEWGTNIVGGTTPGKEGEHLGLPLLPSVQECARQLKPDASAVFVAAQHAGKAIEDAIEAEIPLIVAVAEFIPVHDILRISQMLNTQSKSRLVGANSPGIIAPLGFCRIGFQPLPCYLPGHIGLIAKSGTLSYEAVGALTRENLGQSLCIGMGGDIVAGTNMVEALQVFEKDDDTHAIVLVGEVGGRAEQDAAEWIKDYRRRTQNPKPIVGAVGGVQAKPGRIMGHAGAFASLGEDPADVKAKALADAGVEMVDHPTEFPGALKKMFKSRGIDPATMTVSGSGGQRRGYHTAARRIQRRPQVNEPTQSVTSRVAPQEQRRGLRFEGDKAFKMLEDRGIKTAQDKPNTPDQYFLAITVNRTDRCPALLVSPTTDKDTVFKRAKTLDYDYKEGPTPQTIDAALQHMQMSSLAPEAKNTVGKIINTLAEMFKEKEAWALETHLAGTNDGNVVVSFARFGFDDSAYKSAKRQQDLQDLREKDKEDADELSVEGDGIVYVKLDDPEARIGTLINGAGLAMNANDALYNYGARPTNFLDTGGKATSDTVKKSFEVILKDPRVKVIFVNIFGGLTLCDMIAEGIMLAFKNLDMKIPVVVRLRGTNEEKGQQMIAESGLPLHAFDSFQDAANKCIELAYGEK